MSTKFNNIFLKQKSKKNNFDDIAISSSIFTSSTPSKKDLMDETTDSAYLTNKIKNVHKKVLDSDFIPYFDNSDITSSTAQYGGNSRYTTETINIPGNYTESSSSMSSYSYNKKNQYDQTTTSSSSNYSFSSDITNSDSESESDSTSISESSISEKQQKRQIVKKPPQKQKVKKVIKKSNIVNIKKRSKNTNKKSIKNVIRKASKPKGKKISVQRKSSKHTN
jgi:hypothetical protein